MTYFIVIPYNPRIYLHLFTLSFPNQTGERDLLVIGEVLKTLFLGNLINGCQPLSSFAKTLHRRH